MPRKATTHEEPGSMLEQLGWSKQSALAKDNRPVQELVPILSVCLCCHAFCGSSQRYLVQRVQQYKLLMV